MIFSTEQIARMRDSQERGVSIRKIAADEGMDYQVVWRFLTGRSYQEHSETQWEILKRIEARLIEMDGKITELHQQQLAAFEKLENALS